MLGVSPSQSQRGLGYLVFSQHSEVVAAQWGWGGFGLLGSGMPGLQYRPLPTGGRCARCAPGWDPDPPSGPVLAQIHSRFFTKFISARQKPAPAAHCTRPQ